MVRGGGVARRDTCWREIERTRWGRIDRERGSSACDSDRAHAWFAVDGWGRGGACLVGAFCWRARRIVSLLRRRSPHSRVRRRIRRVSLKAPGLHGAADGAVFHVWHDTLAHALVSSSTSRYRGWRTASGWFTWRVGGRRTASSPVKRVRSTQVNASMKIVRDILDLPTRRSTKMIGTSRMR